MKKDLIIAKQKELIRHLRLFALTNNTAPFQAKWIEKRKQIESELSALESEPDIGNVAKTETDTGKLVDMPDLEKDAEERKTAEEILKKKPAIFTPAGRCVLIEDAEKAMHEFASQSLPEISDSDIELWADIHSQFIGVGNIKNNNLAKQVSFMQGAKRYRDELKRRLE